MDKHLLENITFLHTYTHNLLHLLCSIPHAHGSVYPHPELIMHTYGHTLHLVSVILTPLSHTLTHIHSPAYALMCPGRPPPEFLPIHPLILTHTHLFSSCEHVHMDPLAHTPLYTSPGFLIHTQTGKLPGMVNYTGQSLLWWSVPTTVILTEHQPCARYPALWVLMSFNPHNNHIKYYY